MLEAVSKLVGCILLLVLVYAVRATLVMWCWNAVVSGTLGLPTLGWLESVGLVVLVRNLVSAGVSFRNKQDQK